MVRVVTVIVEVRLGNRDAAGDGSDGRDGFIVWRLALCRDFIVPHSPYANSFDSENETLTPSLRSDSSDSKEG